MYNRYTDLYADGGIPAADERGDAFHSPRESFSPSPPQAVSPASKLRGMLDGLFGSNIDTGDILLILVLLLLYLEKEDEEILIILSALIVMSLQS